MTPRMYIVASAQSILSRFTRSSGKVVWRMDDWHVGDNSCLTRSEALQKGLANAQAQHGKVTFAVAHVFDPGSTHGFCGLEEQFAKATHRLVGSRLWEATVGLDKAFCLIEFIVLPADQQPELVFSPVLLNLTRTSTAA